MLGKLEDINTFINKKSFSDRTTDEWANIFNSMSEMVTIHDKNFNIICANASAEKNLKLPPLIHGKMKCFRYYHGTDCPPEGCPSCETLITGRPAMFEMYEPHIKKYIEIRALPRRDRENKIIGVIHIVRDITRLNNSEGKLRDSRKQLRNLATHLFTVREQERERIAREIHDELGQSLTALKMDLIVLGKKAGTDTSILHKIKSMSEIVNMTIHTVQRISSDLRPKQLQELGLQAAIKWNAKKFQDRTGITCRVALNVENIMLDYNRDITLFRIFQEALTNVCRHARASTVQVNLKENAGRLMMEIIDNGRGINERQLTHSDSLGIIGMRERVHMMRGSLEITGTPNKGTKVSVRIPFDRSGSKSSNHVSGESRNSRKKRKVIKNKNNYCL